MTSLHTGVMFSEARSGVKKLGGGIRWVFALIKVTLLFTSLPLLLQMPLLPVNWTWYDLPSTPSVMFPFICNVGALNTWVSFQEHPPIPFSLYYFLKLSLSPQSISMLLSYLLFLPLYPLLLFTFSIPLPANTEIVYASDKKMPLILRFVGEQTDAIGQLLFWVEFSVWGVCGIHGNKVGCKYPPSYWAEWKGRADEKRQWNNTLNWKAWARL